MQFPINGVSSAVTSTTTNGEVTQVNQTQPARPVAEEAMVTVAQQNYRPVASPRPNTPRIANYDRRGRGPTRRVADRRQKQVPILLDTRSGNDRRQQKRRDDDDSAPRINIEA